MSRTFPSLTLASSGQAALALAVLGWASGCSVPADERDRDETTSEESRAVDDDATSDTDVDADESDVAPRIDAGGSLDAGRDARVPSERDAASTPDAGRGGSDGGDAPLTCDGKPLPPRARGGYGPFPVGPESAGLPGYWPTAGFRSESPDKLGFDPQKLAAAVDFKTAHSTSQAVIVVRHGYVAAEKYFAGFSATQRHESYSMAKSYSSALVGIALEEKKLASLDERVCLSYPMQWNCADAKDARSRITVDHAMNLMTGLMWREDWRSTATGPNDAYSLSMLDTVLGRQATEEPGTRRRYSTGDPALLSGVLQRATGKTVLAYAKEKIFDVIGTPDVRWNQDSKGRTTSYAGLQATARDYAKFGYLYLQRGRWDGKQVVPEAWVDETTRAEAPCEDWNRYLWHQNLHVRLGTQDPACDGIFCAPTAFADLPRDGFFAEGVNGQFIFVIPSADLVVVRLAADKPGSERWDDWARGFLTALLESIRA